MTIWEHGLIYPNTRNRHNLIKLTQACVKVAGYVKP